MKSLSIIKPLECGGIIDFAVQELSLFLSKYVLIRKDDLETDYRISIGTNSLSEQEEFKSNKYVGRGFSIITKGNTYYILSNSDEGLLFGCYRLLHELIGFEVYAVDEIFMFNSIDFKTINLEVVADIPFASRSWLSDKYNKEYFYRLGYSNPHWLIEWHSFISHILPKEKYFEDHPDWYAYPSTRQLCLTNEEMTEEFTKNVISYLDKNSLKDGNTFILRLGHEDNVQYCRCEKCRESDEKYKCSGTLIRFINKVAKKVNKYAEEHYSDKIIKIETFGYSFTTEPPLNEKGRLLDESVRTEKNVGIMYANMAPYWHNQYDKYIKTLEGWSSIGAELYIWLYDSIFDDEFIYLNTIPNTQRLFKKLKDSNTIYLEDMGHRLANISFDAYSNYIRSKLSWNVNSDVEGLTADFFNHYYKEAAIEIKQYFDEINKVEESFTDFTRHCFVIATPEFKESKYWKKDTLVKWINILTKARTKVDSKTALRIDRERLTPLYLYLEIYAFETEKDTLRQYIDMFEKTCLDNNIVYRAEHGAEYSKDIETALAKWRSLL